MRKHAAHLQTKRYVHGYAAREHGAHGHKSAIIPDGQRGQALVNGHRGAQLTARTIPLLQIATLLAHLAERIGNGVEPVVILVRLHGAVATALEQIFGTLWRLPLQLVMLLARAQIPNDALRILGNAHNIFAVGTKVQIIDFLGMRRQLGAQLNLWKAPDAQLSVRAARGHQLSITTDAHHALQRLRAAQEIRLHHIRRLDIEMQTLELL